jgi:para-nitrobenzyl esterase
MTVPSSFPIGSGHTSEVPYLWQSEIIGRLSEPQSRLSHTMIGYWSQLAASGSPHARWLNAWPRYDSGSGEKRLAFLAGGRTQVLDGADYVAEHHCGMWLS